MIRTSEPRIKKISLLFDIRAGEGGLLLLFLLDGLLLGTAQTLSRTSATTVFLNVFNPETIPFVYIGSAVIVPAIGLFYNWLGKLFSFTRQVAINLCVLLAVLMTFYLLISRAPMAGGLVIAFYIWFFVQNLLIHIAFWNMVNRLFNVRQGRRLFGLIALGEIFAQIITGFSISYLVELLGDAVSLLIPALFCIGGMLLILMVIQRSFPLDKPGKVSHLARSQDSGAYRDLFKSRYVLLIVAISVLTLVAYFFIDITFLSETHARYPAEDDLAGFLGLFEAIVSIATLLTGLLVARPIIKRYGVVGGLLALPVFSGIGILALVVSGILPDALLNLTIFFGLGAFIKLVFTTFSETTSKVVFQILPKPLPPDMQNRTQVLVGTIVEPAVGGVVGFILLQLPPNTILYSKILVFVIIVWVAVVFLLGKAYRRVLQDALERRSLGSSFSFEDATSRDMLVRGLASQHPGEVTYYLDMLEHAEKPDTGLLKKHLGILLNHPSPELRLNVLQRIQHLGMTSLMDQVWERVRLEDDPKIRGAAVRAFGVIGKSACVEQILPYLDHPEVEVYMGAIIGLLHSDDHKAFQEASRRLVELKNAVDPEHRRIAARILGESGADHFRPLLSSLLNDRDLKVRREALRAAARLRIPELWDLMIQNLQVPGVREQAAAALAAAGEEVIPYLQTFLQNAAESGTLIPKQTLLRIAMICGRVRSSDAVVLLREQMKFQDMEIRHQVLKSLRNCGFSAPAAEVGDIGADIRQEVAHSAWTMAALRDITGDKSTELLKDALQQKLQRHNEQVFYLLSFIYDPGPIMSAWNTLHFAHASPDKRACALEMIEEVISADFSAMLLPLVEDLSLLERLRHLGSTCPQKRMPPLRRLQEIVLSSDQWISPWEKACALWALRQLDQNVYHYQLKTIHHSRTLDCRFVLDVLGENKPGGKNMLTLIEKVIILKTVSIFAEIPDEILAEVASVMEEEVLLPGVTVFEKGEIGSSMYIIVSGQVRVHDGKKRIAIRGDREVFGEMALLDAQPRSASVTTTLETHLLCLEQELFYEMMSDRIEVARGIITMLTRRLREASKGT